VHKDGDLLAHVACVALNRMHPRHIRHEVDFAFHQRTLNVLKRSASSAAVEFAFGFVQARTAMRARRECNASTSLAALPPHILHGL
jgi:hypothetical protein